MSEPSTQTHTDGPALLWAAAAAVAAFGSWMLFDAFPGINWLLWTGSAAAGLALFTRPTDGERWSVIITGAAATVIAGAAAVTASQELTALICLGVMFFLSLQMLLAAAPSIRSLNIGFAATAPFVAAWNAAFGTLQRAVDATQLIRSTRARAWVRGLAITVPVLAVFALLLAGADPVFAEWRDAVARLLGDWNFMPRLFFFAVLLVIVLGAYGYASASTPRTPLASDEPGGRWLGSTERLMLLGSVAALFWLFLAVQVGYLFGNLPAVPASGMTFAEYARRGFAELTVVASASALLIVGSERYGNKEREGTLRVVTFAVLAAVLLLLASAFRRVLLYEAAYGFTTARLYAQVYMCAVAAALVALSLEAASAFDAGRLFRRATATTTVLFIVLAYWNHEGWIARQNLNRFATTGKLDVAYLTRSLSPDVVPAIMEQLPALPDTMRTEVREAIQKRYTGRRPRRWFEWNLAATRATEAMAKRR
jgi:hypothetical protein